MKVLWITNVIFPDPCKELGIHPPSGGGWMQAAAMALLNQSAEIQLAVASLYNGKTYKVIDQYSIRYYLLPNRNNKKYNTILEDSYRNVANDFKPDIVHIHGSEYPHSLACFNALRGGNPIVVSIQGLVCIYSIYYMGGLSNKEVRLATNLKDVLCRNGLSVQQKDMMKRGEYEKELIRSVKHVIGRTSWDKSCVWMLNPYVHYHFCNETLRSVFYDKKWEWDKCERYTIFLSQGHYPLKGFHKVLEALPLVRRFYPDLKVILAGHNFLNKPAYKIGGYAQYCKALIKKYHLEHLITYVGMMDAEAMAELYQKAHVFVCPSSIENSPNSVGEAQMVGTPVIGSYVGGTMDMIKDGETGFLYRFEETPLLAMRICQLFDNRNLCEEMSAKERIVARIRHDRNMNAKETIKIYNTIINEIY